MGLKNSCYDSLLPNSRRAAKVMEVMKEYGLVRGENARIVPHGRNSF
jgi:hypothetical protein